MYACLSIPIPLSAPPEIAGALEAVAREFSPRMESQKPGLVTIDIDGLGRLLGTPGEIGQELQRACAARSMPASVAVASTRSASMLLAVGAPGLTVVAPGEERRRLGALPLACLSRVMPAGERASAWGDRARLESILELLRRWGLRTLGDLARLPSAALSARIGHAGLAWQRLARGEDLDPLVSQGPEPPIEETLELDWPVEGLEPLSFVLARVLEPIAASLERRDQAVTVLHATFRLASREVVARSLQMPAPMRDPKVLRTLLLLHLESRPLGSGVDRVTIRVETTEGRVTQFSLLGRALPFPEQIATLVARLSALAGEGRVGAPALVDSHRPGAFEMQPFVPSDGTKCITTSLDSPVTRHSLPVTTSSLATTRLSLRRFRLPVAASVMVKEGRPARVTTGRRGLRGGRVEAAAGPWRTSGEWWKAEGGGWKAEGGGRKAEGGEDSVPPPASRLPPLSGWSRDEWDVELSDGAIYRIFHDRANEGWFVEGIVD